MLLVVGGGLILLGLSLNHILSMATTTNNNNNNNNINKAQQRQQPSPAGFQFEVWGKVQGVFFRKYTKQKADEYGVVGWIRNHKGRGTVQGEVVSQDVASKNQMKVWLQSVGSPMSVIEKANFEPINDEHHITELVSKGTFDIRSSARRF